MKKVTQMIFIEAPDEPSFAELFSDTMLEYEATDFRLLTNTSAYIFYEVEIETEVEEIIEEAAPKCNSANGWSCADCDSYWEHKCRCPYADGKVEPLRDACEHFANGGVH